MSENVDPDDGLLEELRSVIDRVEPVPAEVTEFAKAALGWRRLDAELAELLSDSALEDAGALTRSEDPGRWLTFAAGDLTIDLEVQAAGEQRTALGQVAPAPAGATVEVQGADGSVVATAEVDALGRFRFSLEAGGRVRLRFLRHDPAGSPVETSWLSL